MNVITVCVVCDRSNPGFSWTDTHGIGQCVSCGTPYRIYHYEGEGENSKLVKKPPECLVLPEWIPLLRRFRTDTGHIIPGGYSFSGGQEMASEADVRAFNKWCDDHRSEIDAMKAAA